MTYYYSSYFISFEKATKRAWQIVNSQKEVLEAIKMYPQPVIEQVPMRETNKADVFNSREPVGRGDKTPYTKEKALELLKVFYEKNGRLPILAEYNSDYQLPSYTTVTKLLGSKKEWAKLILRPSVPSKPTFFETEEKSKLDQQKKNNLSGTSSQTVLK